MKQYLKFIYVLLIILFFISSAFSMSRRICEGHYELKPINLFVYYPIHVLYLSYAAYADGNYWLAGFCDAAIIYNVIWSMTKYNEKEGLGFRFESVCGITLLPLMLNPYFSLADSLLHDDSPKMYRSIVGIAIPIIIALITDWKIEECVEDEKKALSLSPEFSPEYTGINIKYRF